ncbi:MAG: TonB-dependent receptor [Thermodesulfobacteriota bacterium]
MRLSAAIFLSIISIFAIRPVFAADTELDTIVVTATRTDSNVEKLPSSITVITNEDIQNSTATTVQDVLKNVEGLTIRDLYGTGTKSIIDGRGFARGVNTVVLIDGRRVNEIDLSGVDWNLIPLENVERIEVVRGTGSVLYGDNATSGVINIITKKGKTETTSIDVEGRMESFSGSSENLSISERGEKYNYYIFGKTKKTGGYRDNGEFSAKDLTGRLGLTPSDSFYLDIEGGTHSDSQGLPGGLTEAELKADRKQTTSPDNGVDYDQYYYNAIAGFDFQDHYNLELSYGFNNREFDSDIFFFGSLFNMVRDTNRTELKAKFIARRDIAGNKNVFVAGADNYVSKVDNKSISSWGTTVSDVEKKETGYYIEDEFSLAPGITLLAGFRRTIAKFEDTVVDTFSGTNSGEKTIKRNSSKLGITYNHVEGGKFFVSYSNGFRLPTTDELFSFDGTITLLEPEKAVTYEAGVSHPLSKDTSASLTVYTMKVEDELFYNPATGFFGANENISSVNHKGVEAGIETNLTKWLKVSANGTYSKATIESGQFSGNNMPLIPKYGANLSGTASLTDELKLSLNANYAGSRFIENDLTNAQEKLASRTTVDAKLSYGMKSITAFVGVNNLFNKEYSDYAVVNTTGTVKNFYPAPERWYYAGIKAAF